MDAWQLFVPAIAILIPLLRLILFRRGDDGRRGRLPPGPPAVPLLGSTVWLTNSLYDAEPVVKRLMSRHGPVVSLRFGSQLLVFVADRRLAHAALVESGASLADRPSQAASARLVGEGDTMISRASYGPVWRLLRRNLVADTLHPSRAHLFAPVRARVRRLLVDRLREEHGEAEAAPRAVVETFQYAMFCLLVLMCFGEQLDEDAAPLPRPFPKGLKPSGGRKEDFFVPLINSRREYKKNGGEPKKETTTFTHSYVDNLLDINLPEDGNRALTDDELVMLCSEFLVAGTDSTSAALQWIMAELVRNPSIQSKLYEEIKSKTGGGGQHEVSEEDVHDMPYLKAVVLEGLRKHPPAHMLLPHKAAEDMDVGGYLIPKGTIVNFMVAEMGRDEKEWEKPMEFMPERFLPGGDGEGVDVTSSKGIRMMPFGVGRRICPGLGIAMLHLEYFVANMVREFEWKEVAGDEVDFAEKREFNTVMAKPLRVRLVPRSTLE
ncbi:hypothetical protein OsJ_32154 [Oryza sativa Japonica Group]|uniref:Cytochrome P450 n=1 Tax=Oryza sativa subsp. japonica TaxID=39947 RepID=A3C6G6_ORYSJ|nr:hypothetical protein OsJ_32154 [Oryza sativa Japonica Group]